MPFRENHPQSELHRLLSRFADYGHQMETPIFQVFDEIAEEIDQKQKENSMTSKEHTIHSLADALMKRDQDKAVQCFSKGATVTSPLYGTNEASQHFKLLFKDLKSCQIKIVDIFSSINNPSHMIAIFDVLFELQ